VYGLIADVKATRTGVGPLPPAGADAWAKISPRETMRPYNSLRRYFHDKRISNSFDSNRSKDIVNCDLMEESYG
jgi:hypothetical protein